MTDRTKALLISQNKQNLRNSISSDSSEDSEMDYNLYCFSQGYKTHEKGYWRGVLRNKKVDFDLRFNKDWNFPVGLEPDVFASSLDSLTRSGPQKQGTKKFPKELLDYVNDNEIDWDKDQFKNFKKYQTQTGDKKQKNKEWVFSNGIKRNSGAVELRTQNYKQFEESEKNKELKKAYLLEKNKAKTKPKEEEESEYIYQTGKQYEYSGKKRPSSNLDNTLKTANDTYNSLHSYNTLSLSGSNINEQKGSLGISGTNKRIDTDFSGQKKVTDVTSKYLQKEYNYDQNKRPKLQKERDKSYDINKTDGIQSKFLSTFDSDKYRKTIPKGIEQKSYVTKYGTETSKNKGLVKEKSYSNVPQKVGKQTSYTTKYEPQPQSTYTEKKSVTKDVTYSYLPKEVGKKSIDTTSYYPIGKSVDTTQKSSVYVKTSPEKYLPKSTVSLVTKVEKKKEKVNRKPESIKSEIIISSIKEGKTGLDLDRKPWMDQTGLKTSEKTKHLITGKKTTSPIKIEPITYGATRNLQTKPLETLKTESLYSRTNLEKTPLSQSHQQIHSTTFTKTKVQQSQVQPNITKTSPYKSQKPSTQPLVEKTRTISYGQTKPQDDSKYVFYSDIKTKQSPKADDKSKVKKSDIDDILKDLRKEQASYDLRTNKESPMGKPGEYSVFAQKKETKVDILHGPAGKPSAKTSVVKVKTERIDKFGKVDDEEKKRRERLGKKISPRKHEKMYGDKKQKKTSFGGEEIPLTNISRLRVDSVNNGLMTIDKDKSPYKETEPSKLTTAQFGTLKTTTSPLDTKGSSVSSYVLTTIPQDKKTLTSKQYQTIDSTSSSYNYPVSTKKPITTITKTQIHTEIIPSTNYLKKSQETSTYQKNKQFGLPKDYNQYSLASRTQDSGFNTYSTYSPSSSQFNTAAYTKKPKHGRLNKSAEGLDDLLLKEQKPFGQTILTESSGIESQRSTSLPKKPIVPAQKRRYQQATTEKQKQKITRIEPYKKTPQEHPSTIKEYKTDYPSHLTQSYTKTETSYVQKRTIPEDKAKTDYSKNMKPITTQVKKSKITEVKRDNIPEIYEYYPPSTISQKDKIVQISKISKTDKPKKESTSVIKYQTKITPLYKTSTTSKEKDYKFKPYSSQTNIQKPISHKRTYSQSSGVESKKSDFTLDRKGFDTNLDKNGYLPSGLELLKRNQIETKYNTIQNKNLKTPSYQRDSNKIIDNKSRPSLGLSNILPKASNVVEKKDKLRTKSIQNNKYGVVITSPAQRGKGNMTPGMAFFKLQFLTTKEVCEKFWKSIDEGELSASMFEFNRNSGTSSRLTNFLSPEKNRASRMSLSNENTEYSTGYTPALKQKMGFKGIMKNIRETRQTYKSGNN